MKNNKISESFKYADSTHTHLCSHKPHTLAQPVYEKCFPSKRVLNFKERFDFILSEHTEDVDVQ